MTRSNLLSGVGISGGSGDLHGGVEFAGSQSGGDDVAFGEPSGRSDRPAFPVKSQRVASGKDLIRVRGGESLRRVVDPSFRLGKAALDHPSKSVGRRRQGRRGDRQSTPGGDPFQACPVPIEPRPPSRNLALNGDLQTTFEIIESSLMRNEKSVRPTQDLVPGCEFKPGRGFAASAFDE